jgi:hypothetical protein
MYFIFLLNFLVCWFQVCISCGTQLEFLYLKLRDDVSSNFKKKYNLQLKRDV